MASSVPLSFLRISVQPLGAVIVVSVPPLADTAATRTSPIVAPAGLVMGSEVKGDDSFVLELPASQPIALMTAGRRATSWATQFAAKLALTVAVLSPVAPALAWL